MRAVGIVAEYNPFHRGHAYHIRETGRLLGRDRAVVCAMSGNWVQRGECALTDKWTRAAVALRGGADLVLELPTAWAVASAERFAQGAVEILKATGVVDTISFGSESGQLEGLRAAAASLDSAEYREVLLAELSRGVSFASARQAAVRRVSGSAAEVLGTPNNNLAVEYLRAMGTELEAVTVLRAGVAHDGGAAEGYASASALREWLRQGKIQRSEEYLTEPWQGDVASMEWCERAILARLRSMTAREAEALPDSSEGLGQRLLGAAGRAEDLETLYALTKTKRYAHARIRRLALWAFLGLRNEERPHRVPYLRVLGMNGRGKSLLREMGEQASCPILTKPAHVRKLSEEAHRLFEEEARYTDLYGLCFSKPRPSGAEWTTNPIVME